MTTAPFSSTSFPFRSEKIVKIFSYLLKKPALARELAQLIQSESKQIYPRLLTYIRKGWVSVAKINNMNIYALTENARRILSAKPRSFEEIRKKAEERLGRKLDENELEILRYFYEKGTYVERTRNMSIGEIVYEDLRKRKQISLKEIEEILEEFTSKGILFAYRPGKIILKVRLDKRLLE